jgi:transaldolase/transaldolase/glucose-6-phosphate isomerase
MNPLRRLNELGQSVWLDNLRRRDLTSGALKRLIDEDGLRGLTSNPTIFQKAVEGSTDYQGLFEANGHNGATALEVYEKLVVRDIQDAADLFRPVFEATEGRDGFVSLEVSPAAAFHTKDTLAEARHLWGAVGRPNLMIKVPGTEEGLPAIKQLTAEGMNINITLLFSQEMYRRVAEAYVEGLEAFGKSGGDVRKVASVASFFVSRIDSLVDSMVEKKREENPSAELKKALDAVEGKVAIANAKLAYRIYQEVFATARWKRLVEQGARTQRVLWASTSTKNPKYRDVLYVEELVGQDTVDTMPPATIDAFRDHGKVRASLTEDVAQAEDVMRQLEKAGISMKAVTDELVKDGVRLFGESFDKLVSAIGTKLSAARQSPAG